MGGSNSTLVDTSGMGVEIDHFQAKYVGSVPVKTASGHDVCESAVTRLLDLKVKEKAVFLKITTNGVYVIDPKTNDNLKEVAITDVSFVSQYQLDPSIISFFENDIALRLITCHCFRAQKHSYQIPVAINESFKVLQGHAEPPTGGKKQRRVSRQMSKKDAIKSSTAKSTTIDKGELLQEYPCKFLGSVNVSKPRGEEVTTEANSRIDKISGKPQGGKLVIFEKAMEVFIKSELELQAPIRDVSFATMNEERTRFSFIVHDRRRDEMTCTSLMVEVGEDQPSIRRTIDGAQKKLIAAAKKKHKEDQLEKAAQAILDGADPSKVKAPKEASKDEIETGQILGTFECTFLGSCAVDEVKGQHIVEGAIKKILKSKMPPEGVFIQVSTEGIKTFDSLSSDIVSTCVVKDVSFTTVAGKHKDMFSFIKKDDALNLITCSVFLCAGERAFDIATTFGDAFKAFAEEQKRTGGNPFKAVGPREAPPGDLFKKQVHRSDLRPKKAIGAGQFGQVYLAEQIVGEGQGDEGSDRIKRAVKMLRGAASSVDKDEFVAESTVMLDFDHDNLVNLIGVAMQQKPWLMVLEFLQYGDLRSVLKGCSAQNITLEYKEMLTFATQVAAGMEYLSELRLIHMDLAARNCLVGQNNQCKVADFGLTRRLPEGSSVWRSTKVMKLPVKWCSIEALDDRTFSQASDVWAFGIVMWEIAMYGAMPYGQLKTQEVQRKVREGLRLTAPDTVPGEYHEVATTCWRVSPNDRPNFKQLAGELGTYLRTNAVGSVRDVGATLKAASR